MRRLRVKKLVESSGNHNITASSTMRSLSDVQYEKNGPVHNNGYGWDRHMILLAHDELIGMPLI